MKNKNKTSAVAAASDRRTPETDSQEWDWDEDCSLDDPMIVTACFARKLEIERDEWKAKYIQQNKDLGCELMDPNGTIWGYAKKLETERGQARAQLQAERDLADALANAVACLSSETHQGYSHIKKAFEKWKEARKL